MPFFIKTEYFQVPDQDILVKFKNLGIFYRHVLKGPGLGKLTIHIVFLSEK